MCRNLCYKWLGLVHVVFEGIYQTVLTKISKSPGSSVVFAVGLQWSVILWRSVQVYTQEEDNIHLVCSQQDRGVVTSHISHSNYTVLSAKRWVKSGVRCVLSVSFLLHLPQNNLNWSLLHMKVWKCCIWGYLCLKIGPISQDLKFLHSVEVGEKTSFPE